MKKSVGALKKELAAFRGEATTTEAEFLAQAKDRLLTPAAHFLSYIYDFQVVVEPLVKESLTPLADEGVDPDDAFILYRFFSTSKGSVGSYFDDAITSIDELDQALGEFSKLSGDLLESFTKATKKKYMTWKKEQKA